MRNFILTIVLVFATRGCCTMAVAVDLPPNDAGNHQLIIVGQPDSEPAKWFKSNPTLAQIKKAVAFTLFPPNSQLFKERYQATLGTDFPIVAYLRPDGGVIYFADRNTLPASADGLLTEMKAAVLMAKNAKPASTIPEELLEDCLDGQCDPQDDRNMEPRFPRLHPFRRDDNPLELPISGWFSNTVSSGIWLLFTIVALMLIGFFGILIFGAMIVVMRWIK